MTQEKIKLRIFEAVMASPTLDPSHKHPFLKWGEDQLAKKDQNPVVPNMVAVMDGVTPEEK